MSILSGKISWFGGPSDPSAGGTPASGVPITTPGIAVYNRSTLGGYWMVKLPNGHAVITRQTDIGPAPSTGRKFDFTYSILSSLGYSQKDFPTGSQASGVYLGKTINDVFHNYDSAVANLQLSTDQIPADTGFFSQLQKSGVQGVNYDALSPAGVNASKYQGAITSVATGAADATNTLPSVGDFLAKLADPKTWLRVVEVIGGLALIYVAVRQFATTASAS